MEEDMFIDFDCPCCKAPVSYLAHFGGTAQGCPNCGEPVVVPRQAGEPGRPLAIPFQTPRLALRRLHPRDWKDVLEYHGDEDLFRYTSRQPQTEEEIIHWLDQDQQVKLTQPNQSFRLALMVRETEKVIGDAVLRLTDADHLQANLTLYVNRQFHNQGYGTEALSGLLVFCFRDIGLHRVSCVCDSRNGAAKAMLAKAGLRQEGEFLKAQWVKEEWVDTCWFALLQEEYLARVKAD